MLLMVTLNLERKGRIFVLACLAKKTPYILLDKTWGFLTNSTHLGEFCKGLCI